MEVQDIKNKVSTDEKCHICDEFLDSQNLELHFLKDHSKIKPEESNVIDHKTFTCQVCCTTFGNLEALKSHKIHVHNAKELRFKCELCDRSFYQKCHLESHIKIQHRENEKYHCTVCNKEFGYKCSLKVHVKTYHSNNMWT